MTDTVEKKPRTARPIFVEQWIEQSPASSGVWGASRKCSTIPEAKNWLKKEGEAGGVYRIITVEREITLVVESKRVASFA